MVTFTTNPLIAYEEAARKEYLARALDPIQASSSNPYGFDPMTQGLGKLLQGWLGGQASRRAAKYKTAQKGAQSALLSRIITEGRDPKSATYKIEDDGRYVPIQYTAPTISLDPEMLGTAGATQAETQLSIEQAQELARKRFNERRTIELRQALVEAEDDDTREAIRMALDPVAATAPRKRNISTDVNEFGGITVTNQDTGEIKIYERDKGDNLVLRETISLDDGAADREDEPLLETEDPVDDKPVDDKPVDDQPAFLTRDQKIIKRNFDKITTEQLAARLAEWPDFEAAHSTAEVAYSRALRNIDLAIGIAEKAKVATTGRWSWFAGLDPQNPAARLETLLDSLRAKAGFATLQAMRDASKTGGALGQVSERELKLLILDAFVGKKEAGKDVLLKDLREYRRAVVKSRGIATRLHNNWRYILKIRPIGEDLPSPSAIAPEGDAAKYLEELRRKREKEL
jgi:hypothetical protein